MQYREAYGMFATQRDPVQPRVAAARRDVRHPQGHPRRSPRSWPARSEKLYLGNLDARRDWGFAPEYVEAMWLMLQQAEPDDYVVATGETHTRPRVRRRGAFGRVGLDWQDYVEIDPRYFRPTEVDELLRRPIEGARASSAGSRRTTFQELVRIMVEADLRERGSTREPSHAGVEPADDAQRLWPVAGSWSPAAAGSSVRPSSGASARLA